MKNLLVVLTCLFIFSSNSVAQNCADTAKVIPPVISEAAKKTYGEKLDEAKAQFSREPNDAEAIIWLGRRAAYPGEYKEAIKIFTGGIAKFPADARFYRHRGHRYLTIRCFDDAIADFEKAAKLIKGKKDETEPDGLPNARNIPTSTLQSNIWYHLGLAYYLKGNFKKALSAYRECMKVSKNPDMQVATVHWIYMTVRKMGKEKEARKAVENIPDNLDIVENDDYYKLIKLYQGKIKAEDLLRDIGPASDSLSNASLGYGLGNWYSYNRDLN